VRRAGLRPSPPCSRPIAKAGDFLARDRQMANAMPGDYLAVRDAGAYGFVLSSNYNSRPRAPEILVEDATWRIIANAESQADFNPRRIRVSPATCGADALVCPAPRLIWRLGGLQKYSLPCASLLRRLERPHRP